MKMKRNKLSLLLFLVASAGTGLRDVHASTAVAAGEEHTQLPEDPVAPVPQQHQQAIFDSRISTGRDDVGILRRFSLPHEGSEGRTEEILEIAQEYDLDVWQHTPTHIDIYESPSAPLFPPALLVLPFTSTMVPSYVPPHIPHSPYSSPTPSKLSPDFSTLNLTNTTFHSSYHPLYEIDAFLFHLADPEKSPETAGLDVSVVDLGHSGEGREMRGLRIAVDDAVRKPVTRRDVKKKNRRKDAFVIMGAQHAREWIASAASLYLSHALVANNSEPHSLRHLLESFDFYIIPVPNPDGYTYTWESDRFWYKNRMITSPNAKCLGLDMNRNWGYKWKRNAPDALSAFTSSILKLPPTSIPSIFKKKNPTKPKPPIDPCSHWYPGTRPFQAPEVNNIANFISSIPNVRAFVDLRSYGQMISSPFSWSCKRVPKDAEDQLEAGLGAASAIWRVHGMGFSSGRLCEMLYKAPGNVVDWMYARAGIKYSYAVHLRDTGTYGFSLPAEWIRPVGEETASMIDYLAKFIVKNK